jgi:hypothetical protein
MDILQDLYEKAAEQTGSHTETNLSRFEQTECFTNY